MKTERVELLLGSPLRDDGVRYSRNSVTVGPRKLVNGSVTVERDSNSSKGVISEETTSNIDVGTEEGKCPSNNSYILYVAASSVVQDGPSFPHVMRGAKDTGCSR